MGGLRDVFILWAVLCLMLYLLTQTGQSNVKISDTDTIIKHIDTKPIILMKNETKTIIKPEMPIINQTNFTEPEPVLINNTINETNITIVEPYKCIKTGDYNLANSKLIANKIYAFNQMYRVVVLQLDKCIICFNPNVDPTLWEDPVKNMGIEMGYQLHKDYCKYLI